MKLYNKKLNEDITLLKAFHPKKDKRDFNLLKNEIMRRHNISKATVYREMKKDTPGQYKRPNYNPPVNPVTERDIRMVRELLLRQVPVMEIPKIMEEKTSGKYNWDKVNKIRGIIDARAKDDSAYLTAGYETEFAGGSMELIGDILNLEKIPHGGFAVIKRGGRTLKVTRETQENIELALRKDNPPAGEHPITGRMRKYVIMYDRLMETVHNVLEMAHREEFTPSGNALKELEKLMDKFKKEEIVPALKKVLALPDALLDRLYEEAGLERDSH